MSPVVEIDITAVYVDLTSVSFVFIAIYDFLDVDLQNIKNSVIIGDFNVHGFCDLSLHGIGDNICLQLAGFAAVYNLKQCNHVLNHNNS